eukprot:CAMPEP_0119523820 /NCGR_PEP_ID=MMETSP1344-20130328/38823_1 /TAXON_ID=236787 /ORGANISM="Florenciella parvula, Strain CCMP2471" /LENGTH=191 /DNA_ID=CAMNT_0007562161 /DNA_START=99 /DNA_END=670 /DNA_ORIENTATION=+
MSEDGALTWKLEQAEKRRLREGNDTAELIDAREHVRTFALSHEFYTEAEFDELISKDSIGGIMPSRVDPLDSAMASALRLSSSTRRAVDLDRGGLKHIGDVSALFTALGASNLLAPGITTVFLTFTGAMGPLQDMCAELAAGAEIMAACKNDNFLNTSYEEMVDQVVTPILVDRYRDVVHRLHELALVLKS